MPLPHVPGMSGASKRAVAVQPASPSLGGRQSFLDLFCNRVGLDLGFAPPDGGGDAGHLKAVVLSPAVS